VPVFLDEEGLESAPPDLKQRLGIFRRKERSWEDVAAARPLRSRWVSTHGLPNDNDR
jgi:hypothetical protein